MFALFRREKVHRFPRCERYNKRKWTIHFGVGEIDNIFPVQNSIIQENGGRGELERYGKRASWEVGRQRIHQPRLSSLFKNKRLKFNYEKETLSWLTAHPLTPSKTRNSFGVESRVACLRVKERAKTKSRYRISSLGNLVYRRDGKYSLKGWPMSVLVCKMYVHGLTGPRYKDHRQVATNVPP